MLYWNENWRGICINLGYIDLDNGTISVKHNVYDKPKDEKERWFIGTTKTFAGKRMIHISETLLNALKNYQRKYCFIS